MIGFRWCVIARLVTALELLIHTPVQSPCASLLLVFISQTVEELDAVREVDLSKLESSAMDTTGAADEEEDDSNDSGSDRWFPVLSF